MYAKINIAFILAISINFINSERYVKQCNFLDKFSLKRSIVDYEKIMQIFKMVKFDSQAFLDFLKSSFSLEVCVSKLQWSSEECGEKC